MNLSKKTLESLHRVQAHLMILEHERLSQDVVIQRALDNYDTLIERDAEVEFDKTFPNMFAELKNHRLLEKTK